MNSQQRVGGVLKLKGKTATDIVNELKQKTELNKKRKVEEAIPKEHLKFQKKIQQEQVKKEEQNKLANQEITQEIKKTKSQESFEIITKKRQVEKINEQLKQTHRERLDQFNKGLSKLPEHFDIPKVGPG